MLSGIASAAECPGQSQCSWLGNIPEASGAVQWSCYGTSRFRSRMALIHCWRHVASRFVDCQLVGTDEFACWERPTSSSGGAPLLRKSANRRTCLALLGTAKVVVRSGCFVLFFV